MNLKCGMYATQDCRSGHRYDTRYNFCMASCVKSPSAFLLYQQLHALVTGSATVNLSWAYSGFNSTSLLFGTGCVDGSGSLSSGAFNQLKLVTLSVI